MMKKLLVLILCLISSITMFQSVCAASRRPSNEGLPALAAGCRQLTEAEKADPYIRTLFSRLFCSAAGVQFEDGHNDVGVRPHDADDVAPADRREQSDDVNAAALIGCAPCGIDERIDAGLAWLSDCLFAGMRGAWAYAPLTAGQKTIVEQVTVAIGQSVSRSQRTILTLVITSCVCILLQAGYSTEECVAWFADPINAERVYFCMTHLTHGLPAFGTGLVVAGGVIASFFGGGCSTDICPG
jgi:hypothetical protein